MLLQNGGQRRPHVSDRLQQLSKNVPIDTVGGIFFFKEPYPLKATLVSAAACYRVYDAVQATSISFAFQPERVIQAL